MREKGLEESEDFLVKNTNPYTVGPRDAAPVKEMETLTLALDTAFSDGLDFLEDVFTATPSTPKNALTSRSPKLQTPQPLNKTPSNKTSRMSTPLPVLDGLPTIEECRKLKTKSAPSSTSSDTSRSSCSGCRELSVDVKQLKRSMNTLIKKVESQSATNQQLALSMVNIAGMISTVRAPVTHTTAPAPATATAASTQEEVTRRVVDRSRHHYPSKRQQEWNRQHRERSPIHRRY